MGRILYKDIELDEANKEVHFAHSRFVGRDINTDWMDSLRSIDKNSLSHTQFDDDSDYYGESFEFEEFDKCFHASCGYLESLMELYAQYLCKSIDPERFGGRSSDESSCRDLACEARDMRDGKDAFASTEQENVQGLRDCNR